MGDTDVRWFGKRVECRRELAHGGVVGDVHVFVAEAGLGVRGGWAVVAGEHEGAIMGEAAGGEGRGGEGDAAERFDGVVVNL